jgi:hypothetical protein
MITFTCAPPPSTNALYATVRGKRVKSMRYLKWIDDVGWEIKSQVRGATIVGPFEFMAWLPPGIDIDNIKALIDIMGPPTVRSRHALGITEDDSQMEACHIYRDRNAKVCRVQIAPMAVEWGLDLTKETDRKMAWILGG